MKIMAGDEPNTYLYYCPGCEEMHKFWHNANNQHPSWNYNGDRNAPTVSPSIKITYPFQGKDIICHHFIKAGMIEFCGDSSHKLSGQTVELPHIPAEYYDGL